MRTPIALFCCALVMSGALAFMLAGAVTAWLAAAR